MQGELHADFVALRLGVDGSWVQHVFVLVQVLDEFGDPARVVELRVFLGPLVFKDNGEALIQERQLAQALGQRIVVELDRVEDLPVGQEGNFCAPAFGLPRLLERGQRLAALVGLFPGVALPLLALFSALAPDLEVEPLRKSVDYGDTHAVQAS